MARLAEIQIIGRLGQQPLFNTIQSGRFVCNMSVAVETTKDADPDWFKCEAWEDLAHTIGKLEIDTGDLVYVAGRLKIDRYTARDGTRVAAPIITARNVQLLRRPTKRGKPYDDDADRPDNHATRRTRTDPRPQRNSPPPPEPEPPY